MLSCNPKSWLDNVPAVTKTLGLPGIVDGKDNLDIYPVRFERYATIVGSQRDTWTVRLRPLLTGRALNVNSGLFSEDARDYDKLRKALLLRYGFTEKNIARGLEALNQRNKNHLVS